MKKSNSIKKSHKIKDLMPLLFFLLLCAAGMSKGFTEMKMFPETSPAMDTSASQNTPTTIPVYSKSAYRAAEDLGTSGNIVNPCFETVTQTIELTAGWNWISSYVDMNEVDGLAMLEEALGDYGVTIATSDDIAEYLGDGFWLGLEGYQWANSEMIMVEVSEDCTVSLGGSVVDPSTISITINPGWNWIGFPFDSEMSLEEAMAVFEPELGDGIASYEGITEYIGVWTGDFETLEPGQGYLYYSASDEPKTLIFQTELPAPTHEYVDLGLPSGLLWATCNVGADTPEGYGDYFAWGETQPKDTYNWSTYQYCMGSENTLTKYCNNSNYGYNGFTDNLITLLPEDDAATANWGANWRMPTEEEWQELYQNTTHTWTTQNGVRGRLFTASNGNSLFLPAAGYRSNSNLNYNGSWGRYYSSSLVTNNPRNAWHFYFGSFECGLGKYDYRYYGRSVRAVRSAPLASYVINATAYPEEGGIVIGSGTYAEGAECTLTATPNEGYAFTHWTEDGEVVSTDATYSFMVTGDRNLVANFDHAYVDLGLPSGTLWATCNVGANAPEDYGDYIAWGETQPKETYTWENYQYSNGSENTLTKYCYDASYGYNGFTDNLTTLQPEDDAATANWGSDWRMPTKAEWQELYNNTTVTWTTQNGVNGRLFTASNGNTLFLPAAGYRGSSSLYYAGSGGYYWSSSLYTGNPILAWYLYFSSDGSDVYGGYRDYGRSVRAVRSGLQN